MNMYLLLNIYSHTTRISFYTLTIVGRSFFFLKDVLIFFNHDIGVKYSPILPMTNLCRRIWLATFSKVFSPNYIFFIHVARTQDFFLNNPCPIPLGS